MTARAREWMKTRWSALRETPFGRLARLFAARIFGGGGETAAGELDLGVGVLAILLAMPGTLAALLMFEEYGSFLRWLRGQPNFDPFTAAIPDEYFLIVLSFVVSGAVALWKWDAIFPDRRDYVNLVPLPISLRAIFFANLCAVAGVAAALTVVANGVSAVLFPLAVISGAQGSFAILARFAAGHMAAVFLASAFSFFAVFAAAGALMAILPASLFRRVSLAVRFAGAVALVALLASSFAVPGWLAELPAASAHRAAMIPPLSFLGIARTVWTGGGDSFAREMGKAALGALATAIATAMGAYAVSFRRTFVRIPELADAGPAPRMPRPLAALGFLAGMTRRPSARRACYEFVARTLLRSEIHLQAVLGALGVGLVASAEALISGPRQHSAFAGGAPSVGALSVPFILSFCLLCGMRLSFEIPSDLRASWIFRYWVDPQGDESRAIARRALHAFCAAWLAPAVFLSTGLMWGWADAAMHTAVWLVCAAVLVEILLTRYRKIPFTCPYPSFQRHSPLVAMAYLAGFLIFGSYLPQMDQWILFDPIRGLWLILTAGAILGGIYGYRKQLLDMDKTLIFANN